MSSGGFPKRQSSWSSSSIDLKTKGSSSEMFELKPKPKLFCIPENCSSFLSDLRKTKSLNVHQKFECPEKTCSVLFIGSKYYSAEKQSRLGQL